MRLGTDHPAASVSDQSQSVLHGLLSCYVQLLISTGYGINNICFDGVCAPVVSG
jgi:hypothetical protein